MLLVKYSIIILNKVLYDTWKMHIVCIRQVYLQKFFNIQVMKFFWLYSIYIILFKMYAHLCTVVWGWLKCKSVVKLVGDWNEVFVCVIKKFVHNSSSDQVSGFLVFVPCRVEHVKFVVVGIWNLVFVFRSHYEVWLIYLNNKSL